MTTEGMLKDKVAVVTGAARGIGREIAILMAQHGAKVVVNDYGGAADGQGGEHGPAEQVVKEIQAKGGEAAANFESVATMAGGQSIIKTALDRFGGVDIVVNNAGILRDRMIFNMTEEEWDGVIDTHLKGCFSVTRAAVPQMREKKWGRIINMTSTSGLVGNVGQANYAAAKLGIVGLTKDISGQVFGVRGKEIMLFNHMRPMRNIHHDQGWTPERLADIFPGTLKHHLIPLETSGQYFNYDPMV